MKPIIETLGKVVPTVEGDWNIKNKYSEISIVFDEQSNKSYISKKEVPVGISILNKEYWHCFGNMRIDSDSIILLSRIENGIITSYTLEEAIKSISIEDRRIGMFISFYEKPIGNLLNYRWNLYQFNSNNIDDFLDITAWNSIYYLKTKFYGLFANEEDLYNTKKNPSTGDYAFVGNSLGEANVYVCRIKNVWTFTTEKASEFISIIVKGNVTVGENGNWFNNGIDTGISAKGEKGDKPYIRYNSNTDNIEYSFDNINWDIIISRENIIGPAATIKIGSVVTVSSSTPASVINSGTKGEAIFDFKIPKGETGATGKKGDTGNGLLISGYKDNVDSLPTTTKVGEAWLVGTQTPYNLYIWNGTEWKDNGPINEAQIVLNDNFGNSSTSSMTQRAVTKNVGLDEYEIFSEEKDYNIGDIVNYNGNLKEFTVTHVAGAWIGTDVKDTSVNKINNNKVTELRDTRSIFNINTYINKEDTSTTYTLEESIQLVPENERCLVKIILYRSEDGPKIAIFKSNAYNTGFTNVNNWTVLNDKTYYNNKNKGFSFGSNLLYVDRNAGECIREIKFIPPIGKEEHSFYLKSIPKNGSLNDFYVYDITDSTQCAFICKIGSENKPYSGVYIDILDNDGRNGWEGSKLYIDIDFSLLSSDQYNVTNYVLLLENYTEKDLYFSLTDAIISINKNLEVATKVDADIVDGYFSNGASVVANVEWRYIEVDITDTNKNYWASGSVRPSPTRLVDYINSNGIYISSEYFGTGTLTYYTKQKLNVPSNTAKIRVTSYHTDEPELYIGSVSSLENVKTELEEKIDNFVPSSDSNYWNGKTIWWCGTSIPAGSDSTLGSDETIAGNYPTQVGENLSATVINKAVGGSMCRANVRTGDYNGANFSNITSAFSMTKKEIENFITNYDSIKSKLTGNPPDTLTQSYLNRLRSASFEDRLIPYLNGTYPMPDLFVIDHGHNDWKYNLNGQSDITLEPTRTNITKKDLAEDTYMTANNNEKLKSFFGNLNNINPSDLDNFICSINRNCYIGAINFVITLILTYNPKARIVIISNYEYENGDNPNFAPLIIAQENIAKSWAFPLCEVYKYLGFSNHIIPGTKDYWKDEGHIYDYDINVFTIYNPDRVHPHSDITGDSNKIYAGIISEFIKKCR